MKKLFKGNKYNFKILLSSLNNKQTLFAIEATHNDTKRTSCITTVNVILSELNIPLNVPRFWESEWVLNKKEANRFTKIAKQFFSDKTFLLYLEKYLDLDREQSEWENYE